MNVKQTIMALGVLSVSVVAQARDTTHYYSINEALRSPLAAQVLDKKVKLYFNRTVGGTVLATNLVSNKKTNSFNKTDKVACERAFLSAVKTFQDRAKSMGATKVTNLVSFYKKNVYKSTQNFECHAGTFVSGVALRGDIVK